MILDKFYMLVVNRAKTIAKMGIIVKGEILGTVVKGIGAKEIVVAEINRKEKETECQKH